MTHYQNIVGVLIMVKDEESCINTTLESTKNYFDNIIVYDTGSTDNTISVIKRICEFQSQILHIQTTNDFKGFAQSRNESIIFAETIDVEYLLLMDAGDEFKTSLTREELLQSIKYINYNYGLIAQDWCKNNFITSYANIRLIRNKHGCRYDIDHPVHEKFLCSSSDCFNLGRMIVLFQNRDLYEKKSYERFHGDIEVLLVSKKTPRNYFYLAQTYMELKDFKNGYIYNIKALYLVKQTKDCELSIPFILTRILFCAIAINIDTEIIINCFNLCIEFDSNYVIDAYIYFLRYCVRKEKYELAIPLIEPLSKLEIKPNISEAISFKFVNYDRWQLISLIKKCK